MKRIPVIVLILVLTVSGAGTGKISTPIQMPTGSHWIYIDKTGRTVIDFRESKLQITSAGDFSEGLASVCTEQGCGYIDNTGKLVVPLKFQQAKKFSEGVAPVQSAGKWGFINKAGDLVISPKYEDAYAFAEGLALILMSQKYAFIDHHEAVVVGPTNFVFAFGFSEGLAAVHLGNKWGYIDKTGRMAIEPQYSFAFPFSDGLGAVSIKIPFYFYIDKSGRNVFNKEYRYALPFSDGLATVTKFNLFTGYHAGFIDKTGKEVLSFRFPFPGTGSFSEGLAWIGRKNGVDWDFIDKRGNKLFSVHAANLSQFSEGLACVRVLE